MVSATLFAMAAWLGQWWSVGEVAIGPMGSRHCFDGNCRPGGLAWMNGTELWGRFAVATWAGSLLTMVLLLGLAGALAAQRVPKLLAKSTLASLATTALAGLYWILKVPHVDGLALEHGVVFFAVAVVAGAVTPIRVLRSP